MSVVFIITSNPKALSCPGSLSTGCSGDGPDRTAVGKELHPRAEAVGQEVGGGCGRSPAPHGCEDPAPKAARPPKGTVLGCLGSALC